MTKKLWGGRFSKETDPLVEEFTKSVHYDHKLARYDILGSILHVQVLKKAKYLSPKEAAKLTMALDSLYKATVRGVFKYDAKAEDIHTDIQNKLEAKVGDLALKLHTARSRNEQVVLATKVYCKVELAGLIADLAAVEETLAKLSKKNEDMVIPGFTHMQHAQPVYLKDYLGAYIRMFERDRARLASISNNIELTMGAGALAGTPIPSAKYNVSIQGLKIKSAVNSIDAVSDRDFVIEILSALAICGVHLSRLGEDLIIWSTKEFDFVEIDDAFCTGSSLMPHKKNADVLELIRGYAGHLNGNLISVLTMMKGLPLSYNRDMQLDKEPLFNSIETVSMSLKVLSRLIGTIKFKKVRIEAYLEDESLYATDLVYYLVDKGVPFKTAHAIVGRLVRYSLDNKIEIKSMSEAELHKFSDKFKSQQILKLFNPKASVDSKRSIARR
ncbi:MAG: argininosuccinate lyase [Candidatus Omnitrophica bacterium]|nr:argininosuccinate lyase [Candidatus Omnitrophota bacterium]MCM8790519.1 argininosuccinate lyase [Candidatus Omnitrophota bacterium]